MYSTFYYFPNLFSVSIGHSSNSDNPYPNTAVKEDPAPSHIPVNAQQQAVNTGTNTEKKNEDPHRLLGIPGYQTAYSGQYFPRFNNYFDSLLLILGSRNYDYTQKYPPDELGKEASENARVWKVYLDEAEAFDDEMLRGFRDTLDALLVFVSTFLFMKDTFFEVSTRQLYSLL
jgi:hypothetical protein